MEKTMDKAAISQTLIKGQSVRTGTKGPFSQTPIALQLSAKVPNGGT